MTELFINGKLCDIGSDFVVRLNRKLIQPGELNTKDAQFSFSISLPPTANNHEIFNYANIEETKNKFNREYKAELIVNGIRVFSGLFRMSEIAEDKYRGNLYVPAAKSIKDIFGAKNLNENPEFKIDFTDFVTSVGRYNTGYYGDTPPCIFPYTLYGVLPKVAENNTFSPKDVWDDTVRLGMQDFPPSINAMQMVKHIFKSNGYNIDGSAFRDERLTKLYMSYKNDPDYVQPWNYGRHAMINLQGVWASTYNKRIRDNVRRFERGVSEGYNDGYKAFGCDLLNATNTRIDVWSDLGNNVLYKETPAVEDAYNRTWAQCQVRIPVSGFYKVTFEAGVKLPEAFNWRSTDANTNVQHLSRRSSDMHNSMLCKVYEVRLLRDWGKGDFGLATPKLNGTFYYDNLPQSYRFPYLHSNFDPDTDLPKYFPKIISRGRGQQHFIDAAQDRNLVTGFIFGARSDFNRTDIRFMNPLDDPRLNPGKIGNFTLAQVQVAKPAQSWNTSIEGVTRLAVDNPGYIRYGFFDSNDPDISDDDLPPEGEDEDTDFYDSEKFKIELEGIPAEERDLAFRGNYWGESVEDGEGRAMGRANAVVWFEAGELLTVASVSEEGRYKRSGKKSVYGWTEHEITFRLLIRPFRMEKDWLKVDLAGNGTGVMNWNDPVNFDRDSIDLVKFLPADMKTDEFIDNFCKAFNLKLTQTDSKTFSLDLKQTKKNVSNVYVNLDNLASVRNRSNTPLGLPSLYKLGFTVDQEEEGYHLTKDDGGGEYYTGVSGGGTTEQKNSFSYNWFKGITKDNGVIPLAVISKHEPWDNNTTYTDAMRKRYTNQPLRFWYQDGTFKATYTHLRDMSGDPVPLDITIAKVSNELPGRSKLDYKDQKLTILNNYFTLLVSGSSHFTEVEGYLTPDQYESLNGSVLAMFNGDMYYVAELTGYDPSGRNKTKIKLIRMI